MIIVNIRGANGAGKSSIPCSMLDDPNAEIIWKPYHGFPRRILTLFPKYGWMVMGAYKTQTGGIDRFDDTALIKKTFWYAIKHYSQYNMIMEGVVCSTVFSTYRDLFLEALDKTDVDIHVVNLIPPLEECIKRVYQRNGGNKPVKEDMIADKYRIVKRNVDKFKDAGINSWVWDNSHITDEKLIYQLEEKIVEHGGKLNAHDS